MREKCIVLLRREPVLCVAGVLALGSVALVPPDSGYLSYVDLRVLGLLFSLMLVTAGLQAQGVFTALAQRLLRLAHSRRQLYLLLVLLCFFGAMVITNDVALVTFVPFTITILSMAGLGEKLLPMVVLQTIAANLGSMCTPIGNPQNLYLYAAFDIGMREFLQVMLPPVVLSLALLLICCGVQRNGALEEIASAGEKAQADRRILAFDWLLLALSLLAVLRVVSYGVPLALAVAGGALLDRKALKAVDYNLLLTFLAFFIFIGNVGRISAVRSFLEEVLLGRELLTGFFASQVISNVPAAILLSGFTDNWAELLRGVNIGGLGTLIASMASLISWKLFVQARPAEKGVYLRQFTLLNIAFAVVLLLAALL